MNVSTNFFSQCHCRNILKILAHRCVEIHVLFPMCSPWQNICRCCCWSCVTQEPGGCVDAVQWPTEVQELPEASNSQLMHSPHLPLCLSSPSHALPLCLFPSLSFLSSPFSMSYCSLHLTNPLPPTSSANHSPQPHSFLRACSHMCTHTHAERPTHTYKPPPHSCKAVCNCL